MSANQSQQGFTLLELLTVVSIMSIIAGTVLMTYGDIRTESEEQAVQIEMEQLQQALIRYFRDQNTALDQDDNFLQSSPADISFLIERPEFDPSDLDSDDDNYENDWNPDYRKGWRGPYIKASITAFSDIIANDLGLDGNGDPTSGTAIEVRVKNDPFFQPQKASLPSHYSPYLFFDLDSYDSSPRTARIVSMGADGIYEGPDCDFSVGSSDADYCSVDRLCTPQGDDWVLCL